MTATDVYREGGRACKICMQKVPVGEKEPQGKKGHASFKNTRKSWSAREKESSKREKKRRQYNSNLMVPSLHWTQEMK